MELDELADDPVAAQHLGDVEHEIRGGGARWHLAVEAESDHDRHRLIEGLAQERGLRLDAPDSPPDDAQPVDHGGVRVGADQRVGERGQRAVDLAGGDDVGEVLEVDLVHDPRPRRNDAEAVEGLLRPAEQGVALTVAFVLALNVPRERGGRSEQVDLHAVVDDQVRGNQRVDARRVAAHLGHRVAHRGEINYARDAGKVLEDDACRHEGELVLARLTWVPRGEGANRVGGH